MQYREITGLWSARVPDGPDSDQYPDTVLLEGHVTFEPEYRAPLVYPGEHIVIEPMHAVIHEGVLYGETVVGDDVVRGPLFLPVTVDDAANQTWAWVAKFQGMRLGEYGEEVTLPNVRFQVPAGDDALDLSAVTPASQSDGTITLRGPAGPPGAVPTAADFAIVGPGRPDVPATTGGLVSASTPVGATYTSTDGAGVGAWQWLKTATGWIVTMGETPLVDITPLITASGDWTMVGADRSYIYRINSLVYVSLAPMIATSTNHAKQMDWPTGFQKAAAGPAFSPLIAQQTSDGSPRGFANAHHLGLWLRAAEVGARVMAQVSPFRTTAPWPYTV